MSHNSIQIDNNQLFAGSFRLAAESSIPEFQHISNALAEKITSFVVTSSWPEERDGGWPCKATDIMRLEQRNYEASLQHMATFIQIEPLIREHFCRAAPPVITPKIRFHALLKSLEYHARAAGVDIADLTPEKKAGFRAIVDRMTEANNRTLVQLAILSGDDMPDFNPEDGILESATLIKRWCQEEENQPLLDRINRVSGQIVLPIEICMFSSLNILELEDAYYHINHGRQCRALPESIGELSALEKISIHEQKWLPASLGKLRSLRELRLSRCLIAYLPESTGALQQLETLRIESSRLKVFPAPIRGLVSLKSLDLVPEHSFGIANVGIANVPDWIGEFTELTRLNLERNSVGSLPKSLERLTNLEYLDLGENKLTAIPDIGKLKKLKLVCLNDNQLKEVPESMSDLTDLELVDLGENQLTHVPDLSKAHSLWRLAICGNQLPVIPSFLEKMHEIRELYIENNPFCDGAL